MDTQTQEGNSPELNSCIYDQLLFDKWGKDSFFSKRCWKNWVITCRKTILKPYLIPVTKINTKWIKDLKCETVKLLEET